MNFHDLHRVPVNDRDNPSVSSITVRQDPVIHPRVFEAFYDRERGAWKDRFDRPWWRLIVDSRGDIFG